MARVPYRGLTGAQFLGLTDLPLAFEVTRRRSITWAAYCGTLLPRGEALGEREATPLLGEAISLASAALGEVEACLGFRTLLF